MSDDAVASADVGVGLIVDKRLVIVGIAGVVDLGFLCQVGTAAVVDDSASTVVVALADAFWQLDEVLEEGGIGQTVFRQFRIPDILENTILSHFFTRLVPSFIFNLRN